MPRLQLSSKLAHRVLAMLCEVQPAADPDRSSSAIHGIRLAIGVHGERVVTVAATDGKILMEREDTIPTDDWSLSVVEDLIIPSHLPLKTWLKAATTKGAHGLHFHVQPESRKGKACISCQWTFPDGSAGAKFDTLNTLDNGVKFPSYRMAFDSHSMTHQAVPSPIGINARRLARLTEAWPTGTLSMTYGRGLVFKPVQQGDDDARNFDGIARRALLMPTTLK
jgi:hypothetical protein